MNSVCYKCEKRRYPTCYSECPERREELARLSELKAARKRVLRTGVDVVGVAIKGNKWKVGQR